jgi:predicted ATP-binding protein involved in virulence
MHIDKLTLMQFRGATSLPLELDNHLNVFVGMNGTGKSTILDAAALSLSWLVNRIKSSTASGRPVTEQDIQNGTSSAKVYIDCIHGTTRYTWTLVKTRKGYKASAERSSYQQVNELAKHFQEQITATNGRVDLPLFAYYPVNRTVLDIPLRIRKKHRFELLSAFDDSLTSGADFRTFFEWFREREDLENEIRKAVQEGYAIDEVLQFPDPQLEAVRKALTGFMPEFTNLTVRRSPLRMEVEKNGTRMTVNQLSDGEKCLMAMVGDLARRLAIANPTRSNPLEGDGVILIDEIDLHLHPRWQRRIIPKLLEVFPGCQFLVSTHSPHVITHVQPENLFLLSQDENGIHAEHPTESYGKNVTRVLEDLMGLETTRPDVVDQELGLIFEQIEQGELEAARQGIDKLRKEIGEDPDLIKASVLIRRKELIGK